MKQFTFLCKPKVVYGTGCVCSLPEEAKNLGAKRALLVADTFFARTPAFEKIKDSLAQAGLLGVVFDRVAGEPGTETGDECAEMGKTHRCDLVIGLGGGSTLDTAKAAAVLITNGGHIRDYQGLDKVPGPGLPKIMIPTTAGTGSEVTFTAVFIRKDEKKKGGINSRFLYPEVAMLDPDLTLTLPPDITAATGLDALCHGLESFISKKANFLTELVSREAVSMVWNNLPSAYAEGTNQPARANMLYGSFLAGLGLANAGVTAVHSISYPLGGTFGVPHGVGNGLLLPYVLEFDLPEIGEKIGRLAQSVNPEWRNFSPEQAAEEFVTGLKRFLELFRIPKLKELKIPTESFSQLARDALKVSVPIENNPRPIAEQDIVEIYRKAY